MARQSHRNPWKSLKERGDLQERHVQMAIDLGMSADTILGQQAQARMPGPRLRGSALCPDPATVPTQTPSPALAISQFLECQSVAPIVTATATGASRNTVKAICWEFAF